MLPIGGYKGSGLSMLMDILGGVISGAAFAGGVADQYKAYDRPQDVGHFFLAMRPDCSSRRRTTAPAWTRWWNACALPQGEGFDEILIPGEPETRLEAEHRRTGIPYAPREADLQAEATRQACAAPGVHARSA